MNLILGRQLRAARVFLNWQQLQLAKKAGVAVGTIRRMESFDGQVGGHSETLMKVVEALEKGGIEFLYGDQPGIRLKRFTKHKSKRRHP